MPRVLRLLAGSVSEMLALVLDRGAVRLGSPGQEPASALLKPKAMRQEGGCEDVARLDERVTRSGQ